MSTPPEARKDTSSQVRAVYGKVRSESWRGDSNPQPPVYKSQSMRGATRL